MTLDPINLLNLIKCKYYHMLPATNEYDGKYRIIPAHPATGILYITTNSLDFISGHVRLRGKDGGRYPYNYLEMIDNIFGKEDNTINFLTSRNTPDMSTIRK
jgi:hypothetical protein